MFYGLPKGQGLDHPINMAQILDQGYYQPHQPGSLGPGSSAALSYYNW